MPFCLLFDYTRAHGLVEKGSKRVERRSSKSFSAADQHLFSSGAAWPAMNSPCIILQRKRLLPCPQLCRQERSQPLGQSDRKKRKLQKLPAHMYFLIQTLLETSGSLAAEKRKDFVSNLQSDHVHKVGKKRCSREGKRIGRQGKEVAGLGGAAGCKESEAIG